MRNDGRGERSVKGNVKVIRHLNAVLTNELTAIDQYFLHARMFDHWGLTKVGGYERKASIDEMKHAERGFRTCKTCTSSLLARAWKKR
jgi:bacterioferritin